MVLSIVSSLHPVWICNCFFEGAYFLFHVVDYKIHLGRVLGFSDSSVGKESTCNVGDPSLIPRSRKSTGEGIGYELQHAWASLVAQLVRICLQCRRPGLDPWVGKIPWRRERLPTLVFWPGEFCGVCNPWGHKKSDMTEWLHTWTLYVFQKLVITQEKSYQIYMWNGCKIIVYPYLVDVLAKNIFCVAEIFICIETIKPSWMFLSNHHYLKVSWSHRMAILYKVVPMWNIFSLSIISFEYFSRRSYNCLWLLVFG